MSRITAKVKAAVTKALAEYGDQITIVDRNGNRYPIDAIARRPVFVLTADVTVSEYYFLISAGDFTRIQEAIGNDASPPPFFGDERIEFDGDTYVLRSSEPFEWYDGARQVIRVWGVKQK